jgi:predicted RNA polymerase sigma factor
MDLAEEAAQEAFAIAAEQWPREGSPQNPVAWLVATGRNRAIDRVRRERTLEDKTRLLEADPTGRDHARARPRRQHDPGRAPGADLHVLPSRRWPSMPRWR